jgi:hypothetical protein
MNERRKTQRDRLQVASSILNELYNSILAGEAIGRERLADIREALRAVRDEREEEPKPYQERRFLMPLLSYSQTFDSTDLPQTMVQLLRDALGEFAFNRTPVADYVLRRYPSLPWDQKLEKQKEVHHRVCLAQDLAVEHVEVSLFDPRLAG